MTKSLLNDRLFETMLETAVCEEFQKELGAIDWSHEEAYIFSPEHNKRIAHLLGAEKKNPAGKKLFTTAKRAAVFILALISISFASIMTIDTVQAEVCRIITAWYEKYVGVSFKNSTSKNSEPLKIMLPSYIPQGYELGELVQNDIAAYADYFNEDGLMLSYVQRIMPKNDSFSIDSEGHTVERVQINGYEGLLFLADDDWKSSLLTWNDGTYSYLIDGNIDVGTIILIAESVYISE